MDRSTELPRGGRLTSSAVILINYRNALGVPMTELLE